MKKILVVLGLLVLASPALADLTMAVPEPVLGHMGAGASLRAATPVYDNTVNGPTSAYSQAIGAEIGDEVLVDKTACPTCQFVDSVAFSVYNGGSATAAMTSADISLKFYDADTYPPVLVGQLDLTGVTFGTGLAPGYFTTFELTDIYNALLLPGEIDPEIGEIPCGTTGNYMLITQTVFNTQTGALPGTVLMNPPAVGASGNYFYKNGSWLWFGSTGPIANFYYGIGCVVPEPASLALLGLAGIVVLRRRR